MTEDDYIEYLGQGEVTASSRWPRGSAPAEPLPLPRLHMADWNLRVILKRIWGDRPLELPVVGRAARDEAPRAGVLATLDVTCSR